MIITLTVATPPSGASVKQLLANAGDARDVGFDP